MTVIPGELMDILGLHKREANARAGVDHHRIPEPTIGYLIPPLKQLQG